MVQQLAKFSPSTNDLRFVDLDITDLHRRGLRFPPDLIRSGVYIVTFVSGERYLGQASDIVIRLGGHRRTWDDIYRVSFSPLPPEQLEASVRACAANLGSFIQSFKAFTGSDRSFAKVVPGGGSHLTRIGWIEENLVGNEAESRREPDGQRERTRPLFDRLSAHPEFNRLVELIRLYLDRLIPHPAATEYRNWVITSLPSTVKTRMWHRLICLSVNNVEALTIGEQFDGSRWTVCGFLSAAELPSKLGSQILPIAARRSGAYLAPTYYRTVGHVSQIGFDSLAALGPLLDSDRVLDLAGDLVMAIMRRGRGLYGRFHDYNLADVLLDREPPSPQPVQSPIRDEPT